MMPGNKENHRINHKISLPIYMPDDNHRTTLQEKSNAMDDGMRGYRSPTFQIQAMTVAVSSNQKLQIVFFFLVQKQE